MEAGVGWLKSTKIGRFEIDADTIDNYPDVLKKIMGTVIVIHAEFRVEKKAIEYYAIGEEFDELEEGAEAVPYDVEYDPDTETVSWSKQGG